MKKIIMFTLLVSLLFSAAVTMADTSVPTNGPVVPQKAGWRHLNPGQEDCPIWFPFFGCYTPRQ